jgi:agmatine/peptidylarginine deiminase
MLDTRGNLFMTSITYTWNKDKSTTQIHEILKQYFGATQIHVLEYAGFPYNPTDGTGHLDMFCKLLNDNTVLISTANTEPFKSNGLKAIKYFQSLTAPSGNPYNILTVNGFEIDNVWYTYTNSLIVNNVVLMPQYSENTEFEKQAIEQYKKGIPGVLVVPINSDSSIVKGGSIHCVTQTVPRI